MGQTLGYAMLCLRFHVESLKRGEVFMPQRNWSNGAFPGPMQKGRGVFGARVLTSHPTLSSPLPAPPLRLLLLLWYYIIYIWIRDIIWHYYYYFIQKSNILSCRKQWTIVCLVPPLMTSSKCPQATSPSFLSQQWWGVLSEGLPLGSHTTRFGFLWFDASLTGNLQPHFQSPKETGLKHHGGKSSGNTVDPLLSFPFRWTPQKSGMKLRSILLFHL